MSFFGPPFHPQVISCVRTQQLVTRKKNVWRLAATSAANDSSDFLLYRSSQRVYTWAQTGSIILENETLSSSSDQRAEFEESGERNTGIAYGGKLYSC